MQLLELELLCYSSGQGSSVVPGKTVPDGSHLHHRGVGSTVTALIWERNKLKALKLHPNVTVLASLGDVSQQQRFTLLGGWHRRRVSIFNPINLIATAVISSVVLSEQMFVGRIIGAFVIIIGISFVLWGKMGEQTTPPPPPPPPEPEATEV